VTLAPLGLKRRGASTSPSVPSGQLAGLLPCSQGVFNKRSGSTTGFSQPRISLSENTRNRARAEALARPLERVPDVRPIAQPKSLETIAGECGVTVAALEEHIQDELKSFCVETATSKFCYSKHWALFDTLYNLFLQSNDNQSTEWIRNARDFDSFIKHFCPQSNKNSLSILINHIGAFFRYHLPPMLQFTGNEVNTIYNGPRNWMQLPEALVDMEVVEEARQLVNEGFTGKEKLFVHGTGSVAMANFAKNQAIWSASLAIKSGDKVVSGEYVSYISSKDGKTSLAGGASGLKNIYTSREGLSSKDYTMRRWFDETPVTFGISEEKQRAYNGARKIKLQYDNPSNEGVQVGPIVPLENVVAISAPKASEARIRSWIAAHCPHAKFVSYEAATILESDNLLGLLPG